MDSHHGADIRDEEIRVLIRQGQEHFEQGQKCLNQGNDSFNHALDLMMKKYSRNIYFLCSNILSYQNVSNVEDAIQEVFINIRNNIYSFKGTNIINWIRVLARNECLSYIRKERNLLRHDNIILKDNKINDDLNHKDMLKEFLPKIKMEDKIIISLRYLYGLSSKDIADILDIKPQTANVRVHRAMKRLRKIMDIEQQASGPSSKST